MQYDEFIKLVQERAKLDSREDAERLIGITMVTLAEPMSREETNRLASQLPVQIKRLLEGHHEEPIPAKQTMRSFEIEEFYNRVKGRLGVSYQQGVDQVRAVMTVVREAVTPGIIDSLLQDLPDGYESLFTREGQGR